MRISWGKIVPVIALLSLVACGRLMAQQDATISDKDILILHFEKMPYPTSAQVQGVVVVRVSLDETGKVTDATAISGHDWFVQAAIENAKKMTFQPNSRKAAIVVYNFVIADGECDGSQTIRYGRNLITVTKCPMIVQANREPDARVAP